MKYNECKVIANIKRGDKPLVSKVPIDDFTNAIQNNFDYDFDGTSKFYPYELPKELINEINKSNDIQSIVICGASGSGKSTLAQTLTFAKFTNKQYDNTKALISNFKSVEDATNKLTSVGLNSIPTWCRPRNVLSVGEGFRADVALNIDSHTIFDEFTSTIDRNVAKSCAKGLGKYIKEHDLHNVVFVSCHKDYIDFLQPSIVIDLDEELIYDCRGQALGELLPCKCTKQQTNRFGDCLLTITI